jgi:hypothetical protein
MMQVLGVTKMIEKMIHLTHWFPKKGILFYTISYFDQQFAAFYILEDFFWYVEQSETHFMCLGALVVTFLFFKNS